MGQVAMAVIDKNSVKEIVNTIINYCAEILNKTNQAFPITKDPRSFLLLFYI